MAYNELRLVFVVQLIAVALFVAAFAAPYWFKNSIKTLTGHVGLWKECVSDEFGDEECASYTTETKPSWLTAVQAVESLGLSLAVIGLGMCVRTMVKPSKATIIASAGLGFVAAVLGVVGAIVFHHNVKDGIDVGWCFALNITADVLLLLSSIGLGLSLLRAARTGGYQSLN